MEWEYCAVNAFGWAYGDTMVGAMCALAGSTDGSKAYTEKMREKYLLRVYKFPKGNRPRWQFYCPVWGNDVNLDYWIIDDNMREWESGQLPYKCNTISEE